MWRGLLIRLGGIGLGLVILAVLAMVPNWLAGPVPMIEVSDVPALELKIVEYTNERRMSAGLEPLVHDVVLSDIARSHSENMSRLGLSHDLEGKGPSDRAIGGGHGCRRVSENIMLYPLNRGEWWGLDTAVGAVAFGHVASWMGSLGHKENLLDEGVRRIGVGVAMLENAVDPGTGWRGRVLFTTQMFSPCR